MRVALESSYILHRRPYRDSSLLLDVFSRGHGRVALVARGARGGRRRLPLQPLQPCLLSWSGRGELMTLGAAEPAGPASVLRGETLLCALYLNELLVRLLTRFDPQPHIYDDYRQTLECFASAPAQLAPALRRFEKRLLDALGYGLQLARSVDGRPLDSDGRYLYQIDAGPRPTAGAAGEPPEGVDCEGQTLIDLAAERFERPQTLHESRLLLRAALDQQLGARPLQTRALLADYRRRRERLAGRS